MPKEKSLLPKKLESFLDAQKARYNVTEHRTVYTTYDVARTLKIDDKSVAKTLLIKADNEIVMVVIPGNKNLDFSALKKLINTARKKNEEKTVKKISLVSERVIANRITKKPGAVPPFGNLYKMTMYVDRAVLKPKKIVLNGASFTVSIEMTPKEYQRITEPVMGSFSKARK